MHSSERQTTKYYYARHCGYGINVVFQNSDGTVDSFPGAILRFTSRKSRDAWVFDEAFDGKFTRASMLARDVVSAARGKTRYDWLVWYPVPRLEDPHHFYETLL